MRIRYVLTGAVVSLALGISSTGVATASTYGENGESVGARFSLSATDTETSLQSDAVFYGTNNKETIRLLNEMAEEFERYGNEGAYEDILKVCNDESDSGALVFYSWDTFTNCVGTGLAKTFGLDILKRAFNHEVRQALKSHQWKVASSIMYRNLSKILGKAGASWVIKKIASKALPGGLPGQIAFQVGKCGVKEIW